MSKQDSAFPQVECTTDETYDPNREQYSTHLESFKFVGGLTKRELFAAMALQGLLANSTLIGSLNGNPTPGPYDHKLAREAIVSADALLAELAKDSK